MNIGIDIDDTLTDIRDKLNLAAEKYANELGKENKNEEDKYVEDNNNGNVYQIKYGFTYEYSGTKEKNFYLARISKNENLLMKN